MFCCFYICHQKKYLKHDDFKYPKNKILSGKVSIHAVLENRTILRVQDIWTDNRKKDSPVKKGTYDNVNVGVSVL